MVFPETNDSHSILAIRSQYQLLSQTRFGSRACIQGGLPTHEDARLRNPPGDRIGSRPLELAAVGMAVIGCW